MSLKELRRSKISTRGLRFERYAFYETAKTAYCVIATGERRFYGCFLFTKGVIPPDEGH